LTIQNMAAERWSASLDARAERLASLLTLSTEAMLVWHLDEGIEFWNSGAERLDGFTSEEAVGRTSHALLQTKFPVEFIELITRLRNERHCSGELRHICKDGRIFGYTAEEAIGQPITIVIPQDRQDEERTILTRIRRGERIEHFETVRHRKHGSLIWVSLTISPVKNAEGKIVGASKIARDITEQKRTGDQITTLAREAEHRSKNLLATVQATVNLSQSDTSEGLKRAIEGRIQALANVNSLFVDSHWIGAELSTIATREFEPYLQKGKTRVRINGPQVLLEPSTAQTIAVILHELATNAAKYGALSGPMDGSTCNGHTRQADAYISAGPRREVRQ
jgi:PAS domain S-box-containing protein